MERGPEESAVIGLAHAEHALATGDFSHAIERCEALLAADKAYGEAVRVLGVAHARSGRLDEAVKHLSRAVSLLPQSAAACYELANALHDSGKLDRAIANYRKAIRLRKDFAEAHNDLGTAYHAKGWTDEAISSYRKAIEIDPGHSVARENIGAALRRKADIAGARRHLYAGLKLRVRGAMRGLLHRRARAYSSALDPAFLGACALRYAENASYAPAEGFAKLALSGDAGESSAQCALAVARQAQGDARGALEAARPAARSARSYETLVALGKLLGRLGQTDEARDAYRAAIRRDTGGYLARLSIGILELDRGNVAEASVELDKALGLNPESLRARLGLGRVAIREGRYVDAEKLFDSVLKVEPDNVDGLLWLADAWLEQARYDAVHVLYRRVAAMSLETADEWRRLGQGMSRSGMHAEAVKCLERALQMRPDSLSMLNNRALLLTDLGRLAEATADLRRALELNPGFVDAMINLGRALFFEGKDEEALTWYEEAHRLRPQWQLPLTLKGTWLEAHGRFADAMRCYDEAAKLKHSPTITVNRSHMKLIAGELEAGWELYESRLDLDEFRIAHRQLDVPRWQGEPLAGKRIAVYGEQGLGDEINFASCMPDLLALGPRHVYLSCSAKLEALFRRSFTGVEVFGGGPQEQAAWLRGISPPPDLQVASGSLHRFFRRKRADFPEHRGYLTADPEKVAHWRAKLDALGPRLKVGLSWKGGIVRTGEQRRTLEAGQLLPILREPGVDFVSLQYTDTRRELAELRDSHGVSVHHWQEAIDDYDHTAALVSALDLVISVCTAVIHLGGALNRRVWVLVPIGPHWRYAVEEDGMPWYPSVRLFRQSAFGRWDDVVETVRARLAAEARDQ